MQFARIQRVRTSTGLAATVAAVTVAASLPRAHDPLPSWRAGPAKEAIHAFVDRVVDPSGVHYVPPDQRIAVFDNDGTLWCEKPMYTQMAFMVDRAEAYIEDEPELADQEPYKSLVEGTLDPHRDLEGCERTSIVRSSEAQANLPPSSGLAGGDGLSRRLC